jgi:hypothetical protein
VLVGGANRSAGVAISVLAGMTVAFSVLVGVGLTVSVFPQAVRRRINSRYNNLVLFIILLYGMKIKCI